MYEDSNDTDNTPLDLFDEENQDRLRARSAYYDLDDDEGDDEDGDEGDDSTPSDGYPTPSESEDSWLDSHMEDMMSGGGGMDFD